MSTPESRSNFVFSEIGLLAWKSLEFIGGFGLLVSRTARSLVYDKLDRKEILKQAHAIGVRSLSLTNLIAIFTGMVLALQLIVGLKRFGLQLYSGQIVGLAITRELAPVLTALMVAARVGSGIAAELGSMSVSEQVMAIRAMGGSPTAKLVVPRVLVTTIATPILTIIAIFIGIFGGMVITLLETGVTAHFYLDQVKQTIMVHDFFSGVGKTVFFGFLISTIACHYGLSTTGGTRGVGEATTKTVVTAAVAVFVSDFFLTKLFLLL